MPLKRMLVVGVIAGLSTTGCDMSSTSSGGPEPGSPADRYCDTNSTGPDVVAHNGKTYDADCLDAYPWEK